MTGPGGALPGQAGSPARGQAPLPAQRPDIVRRAGHLVVRQHLVCEGDGSLSVALS